MKIQLKKDEILKGIVLYVQSLGIRTQGKEINVTYKNGRGDKGISAELIITEGKFVLSDVAEDKSTPSLTLVKDTENELVSGTPGVSDNVGNETQVHLEQFTEPSEPKKVSSLFS